MATQFTAKEIIETLTEAGWTITPPKPPLAERPLQEYKHNRIREELDKTDVSDLLDRSKPLPKFIERAPARTLKVLADQAFMSMWPEVRW